MGVGVPRFFDTIHTGGHVMRVVICVPVLGLWAAAAFAQTPPLKDSDHKPLSVETTTLAPGLSPQGLQPVPVPALHSSLVEPPQSVAPGTNRNVIERAIRSLASRIFPRKGSQATPSSQTGFAWRDRSFGAPDFRLKAQPGNAFAPGAR